MSVHEPLPLAAMPPDYPMPVQELEAEAREERVRYLESVAATARTSLPTPVLTSVLTGGAAGSLCEYVETHPVDLVVMTTHGRGGLSRLWLGSVADRMLRRLAVPVLLLHPDETPQPTEFHRLLMALDGEVEDPVLAAVELLRGEGARMHCTLTRVVEPALPVLTGLAARPSRLPPDWNARREVDARSYLARLTDRFCGKGWDVDWQVLVGRGVAGQVLELAEAIRADAIAVGTHGARGVERLLLGSVADKIVRGSRVPVLVAPSPRADEASRQARHSRSASENSITPLVGRTSAKKQFHPWLRGSTAYQ